MKKNGVVIVGAGFSGALAAKRLEAQKGLNVTLIDSKNYFEFTPGILRTIVEPGHASKIESLHRNYLKKAKVIVGEAKEISENHVFVKQKGKTKKIGFDYLLISTGSRYNPPIKEKNLAVSLRRSHLERYYKKLSKAKNILVIGGGLVGIELAAEILEKYPKKSLILVDANKELIERQPLKARKYALRFLEKNNVRIILNERVKGKKGNHYITNKGTRLGADLVFLCTGIGPNSKLLEKHFRNSLGKAKYAEVNEFLQLQGKSKIHENIFVAGDVNNIKEEKTAQNAEAQGKVVAENILRLLQGRKLKTYVPMPRIMVISLGKLNGLLTYKRFVLKGIIPGILKTLIEWKTMLRYR